MKSTHSSVEKKQMGENKTDTDKQHCAITAKCVISTQLTEINSEIPQNTKYI